jgi:hypothetical protein
LRRRKALLSWGGIRNLGLSHGLRLSRTRKMAQCWAQ